MLQRRWGEREAAPATLNQTRHVCDCAARRSAVEGQQDRRESGALCSPHAFIVRTTGLAGGRSHA